MRQTRKLPIYLTTAGMELCYLYLWLALLQKHFEISFLVFALILALYPLSFFAKLMVTRSPRTAERSRLFTAVFATAAASIVTVLAIWQTLMTNHPVAVVILPVIFSGVSWWLGNSLSQAEPNYHYICFHFQCGILAMLAVLVFGGVETTTFLPVALFFTLAILSLALTRWETSLSASTGMLRPLPPLSIILGSAAVLLPSFFIFLVLSPDAVRDMLHWLATMVTNIINLLGLDRPLQASGKPVEIGLISCSCKPAEEEIALPRTPPAVEGTPEQISPVILWVVAFVIFLGILFVILRMVRNIRAQRRVQPADMSDVEITSISAGLLRGLAALFREIVRRLWHLWQTILRHARFIRFRPVPSHEPIESVRALYRSLLRWAARQASPRVPSQTPLEYLKVLCQRFPEEGTGLALITRLYLQARYSSSSPTSEEFEAARKAWQRLRLASQDRVT